MVKDTTHSSKGIPLNPVIYIICCMLSIGYVINILIGGHILPESIGGLFLFLGVVIFLMKVFGVFYIEENKDGNS